MKSIDEHIRSWALKCGTQFGRLNEQWAREMFIELYMQFLQNQRDLVCTTSINGIFELIENYDHGYFEDDVAWKLENDRTKRENGAETNCSCKYKIHPPRNPFILSGLNFN